MTSPDSTLRYGKVIYRVLAGIGDGPDANVLPDGVPVTGNGVLTPRTERIVDRGLGFPATTVIPRPIRVSFVNGYLTYRGDPFAWLIASETGVWRWHAQFTYKIGGDTISDEFLFDLPPGDPDDPNYRGVDLTLARVIVSPQTGVPTVLGPPGRSVADVVVQPDGLLFVMSQGDDIDVEIPFLGRLSEAAATAETAAQTATTQAENAAQSAGASETSAQTAIDAAGSAWTAESNAAGAAGSAAGSAASAEQSAISAAGSASTATTKASAAGDSALAAKASETAARASETAAVEAVQSAQTAASTATTRASEATASAAAAAQSAEDAAAVIRDGVPVHDHTIEDVSGLSDELGSKATRTYVDGKVAGLVDSAPETLDTLRELAAALNDDPEFATTVATQIGGKAPRDHGHAIGDVSGLSAALGGKADLVDGRVPAGQLAAGGATGQVLAKAGGSAVWVDPPESGLPSTPDGPLAVASASYKDAATAARAGTGQLRVVVLGDSTCDGYAGGQANAPTSWAQTWPLVLAAQLRANWGLSAGGRGWVPASTPLLPANYSYNTAAQLPAGRNLDQLNTQIGIPGSLWIHYQHATNAHTVEWTLTAGTTAVDLMLAAYGAPIKITTSSGAQTLSPSGDPVRVRIANPGTMLRVENTAEGGIGVFGVLEYHGDETAGVQVWNLSQGAMSANDYAGWLTGVDMTLPDVLAAADPQVVLVCLGANDYGNGRTSAQMGESMTAIRNAIRAKVPGAVVGWVVRDLPDESGRGPWATYAAAIIAHAQSLGDPVLDMRAVLPNGASGAYLTDGVHYTPAGMTRFADGVAGFLALGGEGITTDVLSDMTAVGRQLARASTPAEVRQVAGIGIVPVRVTQAQYNALPTPRDPNVLYLVKG